MKKEKEHERCLRCHRKLKTAEARKLGYGKICYEKMIAQKHTKPLFEYSLHNVT